MSVMFYTILDKKRLALLPLFKSLVYFDDVTLEKILFKNNNDTTFEVVKDTLRSKVKELSNLQK